MSITDPFLSLFMTIAIGVQRLKAVIQLDSTFPLFSKPPSTESHPVHNLSDRFRKWYDYERDCNSKSLSMLNSVPEPSRLDPEFQKAVDKMAHLVAARRRWLFRLGHFKELPGLFPKAVSLSELPKLISDTESAWSIYLDQLNDSELNRLVEWETPDGKRLRWDVESALTQVFGHAWYHRGQIAQYVARLGGTAVDTDYYFWCELEPIRG